MSPVFRVGQAFRDVQTKRSDYRLVWSVCIWFHPDGWMDVPVGECSLFCCSQCNPQGEAGACPAAVCPEQQQTSHLTEAVGLEFPDYVSDSQLNTITLM